METTYEMSTILMSIVLKGTLIHTTCSAYWSLEESLDPEDLRFFYIFLIGV